MFSCILNQESRGFGGGQCVFISYLLGEKKGVKYLWGNACRKEPLGRLWVHRSCFFHLSSCGFMQRGCEFTYFHQFLVVGRKSLKFSPPGFSLERLKHKCLRKRLRRPIWPKLGSLGTGSSCGVGFSVENSQIPPRWRRPTEIWRCTSLDIA